MGLSSGEKGVKNTLKNLFVDSWSTEKSLEGVHENSKFAKDEIVAVLDGNVLIRQIPTSCTTFGDFVAVFQNYIAQAFKAADTVVCVFDEPMLVTNAKKEEQEKRDAAAKKNQPIVSADLQELICPTNDKYGRAQLLDANPHDTISHRKARARLFDEVCVQTMKAFEARCTREQVLVFDGIDCRGVERRVDEDREACMYANNERIEDLLRRSQALGEGDLKLVDVHSQIQYLRDIGKAFHSIRAVIVSTIDTDAIAIELLHAAAKACEFHGRPEHLHDPLTTLLCFREMNTESIGGNNKRKSPSVDESDDEETTPVIKRKTVSFAVCHVQHLFRDLTEHFGLSGASPNERRFAISLFAAVMAMPKSDFVEIKGVRADMALAALVKFISQIRDEQGRLHFTEPWEIRRDTPHDILERFKHEFSTLLFKFLQIYAEGLENQPYTHTHKKNLKIFFEDFYSSAAINTDEPDIRTTHPADSKTGVSTFEAETPPTKSHALLYRLAWLAVYWAGTQLDDQLERWGFFTTARDSHSVSL